MVEQPLLVCLLPFIFPHRLVAYSNGLKKKKIQTGTRGDPKIWDFIEECCQTGRMGGDDDPAMKALLDHLPFPAPPEDIAFWARLVNIRLDDNRRHLFDEARRMWVDRSGYQGEIYKHIFQLSLHLFSDFCSRDR
jgi:hypothetical protein